MTIRSHPNYNEAWAPIRRFRNSRTLREEVFGIPGLTTPSGNCVGRYDVGSMPNAERIKYRYNYIYLSTKLYGAITYYNIADTRKLEI